MNPDPTRPVQATPLTRPWGYKLFLALFPPSKGTAQQGLDHSVQALCASHGLAGAGVAPSRRHITLHTLGDFKQPVPQLVLDAAQAAAAAVDWPSVPIVFNHAMSFMPSQAFVLGCDNASQVAVQRLRQVLTLALHRVGLRGLASGTPHMTLLYGARPVITRHAIEPICWTATDFALVLSHQGMTYHQWLGRWTLR
jgi:RNA 2',3'-cyclic 3'-phosphodiesterase